MAISVGNTTTALSGGNAGSITVSVPSGGVEDDLLVCFVQFDDNDISAITSPGWQVDIYDDSPTGDDRAHACLSKLHEGGSEAASHVFSKTGGANDSWSARMVVIKGAKTSGWTEDTASIDDNDNSDPNIPTVTPSSADSILLAGMMAGDASGGTAAPPTGYTEIGSIIQEATEYFRLAYQIYTSGGAKGGEEWTDCWTGNGQDNLSISIIIGEFVAGGPASGTGAVSFNGPAVAAAGISSEASGTGALSIAGPTIAGTGTADAPGGPATGDGAVSLAGPAVAGAGLASEAAGVGAVALTGPSVAGTGISSEAAGTGAVGLAGPSIAGTGLSSQSAGVGAIALTGPGVAGAGVASEGAGIGALALLGPSISGTGLAAVTENTGNIALSGPTVAGAGRSSEASGTGAIALAAPTVAGTGTIPSVGTGAVALGGPSIAGTGTSSAASGTGAIGLNGPAVAGVGASAEATGVGAITIAGVTVIGAGLVSVLVDAPAPTRNVLGASTRDRDLQGASRTSTLQGADRDRTLSGPGRKRTMKAG